MVLCNLQHYSNTLQTCKVTQLIVRQTLFVQNSTVDVICIFKAQATVPPCYFNQFKFTKLMKPIVETEGIL